MQVFSSLLSGSKCFIDIPEWRHLRDKIPMHWVLDRIEARCLHTYARLPAFFSEIQRLRRENIDTPSIEACFQAEELQRELILQELEIKALLKVSDKVTELPSVLLLPWFPTFYDFKNVRLSEALCYHWRTLVLFSECLKCLGITDDDTCKRAADAAESLCMSVEHAVSQRALGLIFTALNLQIARMACSGELQRWVDNILEKVKSQLDKQKRHYMTLFEKFMDIRARC